MLGSLRILVGYYGYPHLTLTHSLLQLLKQRLQKRKKDPMHCYHAVVEEESVDLSEKIAR